jgi:hypothetical protein
MFILRLLMFIPRLISRLFVTALVIVMFPVFLFAVFSLVLFVMGYRHHP